MSRYIDADLLQEDFKADHGGKRSLMIDTQPTADVVPVVHAYWIKHGEPPWYVIECSECGAKWQTSGSWDANNFCGNCGSKMDGGYT